MPAKSKTAAAAAKQKSSAIRTLEELITKAKEQSVDLVAMCAARLGIDPSGHCGSTAAAEKDIAAMTVDELKQELKNTHNSKIKGAWHLVACQHVLANRDQTAPARPLLDTPIHDRAAKEGRTGGNAHKSAHCPSEFEHQCCRQLWLEHEHEHDHQHRRD